MGPWPDVQDQVGVSRCGVGHRSSQNVASDPHIIPAAITPREVPGRPVLIGRVPSWGSLLMTLSGREEWTMLFTWDVVAGS